MGSSRQKLLLHVDRQLSKRCTRQRYLDRDVYGNAHADSSEGFEDTGLAAVIDHALVERPKIGIKTAAEFKSQIVKALPMNIRHAVRGVL